SSITIPSKRKDPDDNLHRPGGRAYTRGHRHSRRAAAEEEREGTGACKRGCIRRGWDTRAWRRRVVSHLEQLAVAEAGVRCQRHDSRKYGVPIGAPAREKSRRSEWLDDVGALLHRVRRVSAGAARLSACERSGTRRERRSFTGHG